VTVPFNETVREYHALQPLLEEAVLRALRGGHYVHGPEHGAFEQEVLGAGAVGSSTLVLRSMAGSHRAG